MAIDEEKYDILHRMLDSLKGVDEIIVVDNWMAGYAVPINFGLSEAKGDYLLVCNDDLIWDSGSVKRLCQPDTVTSPKVNGVSQPFWGCAHMIPRTVYEKIGGLSEDYRISYFDDDDFEATLMGAGIPYHCVDTVSVQHPDGGRTLNRIPDRNEWFEENRQKFVDKWGCEPTQLRSFFKLHGRLPRKGEV